MAPWSQPPLPVIWPPPALMPVLMVIFMVVSPVEPSGSTAGGDKGAAAGLDAGLDVDFLHFESLLSETMIDGAA
jgi:hypothetical protein